jgi:hypothetical protein
MSIHDVRDDRHRAHRMGHGRGGAGKGTFLEYDGCRWQSATGLVVAVLGL